MTNDDNLPCDPTRSPIADIMRTRPDGTVFWMGRDLMHRFGYTHWKDFSTFLQRAEAFCQATGRDPTVHFWHIRVGPRDLKDCELTHYGAYLIVAACNSMRPTVAAAQQRYRELLSQPEKPEVIPPTADIQKLRVTILEAVAQAPPGTSPFDVIMHVTTDGIEYWEARELLTFLGYTNWQNMKEVVDRARLACENSGYRQCDHFSDVSKKVAVGSGAVREVGDFELSRLACYFIAISGDAIKKEEVALAQRYFLSAARAYEVGAQKAKPAAEPSPDEDPVVLAGRAIVSLREEQLGMKQDVATVRVETDNLIEALKVTDGQLQQVCRAVAALLAQHRPAPDLPTVPIPPEDYDILVKRYVDEFTRKHRDAGWDYERTYNYLYDEYDRRFGTRCRDNAHKARFKITLDWFRHTGKLAELYTLAAEYLVKPPIM